MTVVVAFLLAGGLIASALWLVAVPLRMRGEPVLPAPQLAQLRRGGRRAAVAAAITELYAAGLVTVDGRGTLRRGDDSGGTALPALARAVYRTLVVPRSFRSLKTRAAVQAALRSTLDDLVSVGAAPGRTRWWLSRLALAGAVAATLYGATRSAALAAVLLAPAVLAMAVVVWLRPRRTVAGARMLRRLRREEAARWREGARAGVVESWTPAEAARSNALTGMILTGLEPALRREVRPRRLFEGGMDLGDGTSAAGTRGGGVDG